MVQAVRDAEKSLGIIDYSLTEKKKKSREFSRSLYIAQDMQKGEEITYENVRSVRPGFGLHPKHLKELIGKKINQDVTKGTRMSFDLVEK